MRRFGFIVLTAILLALSGCRLATPTPACPTPRPPSERAITPENVAQLAEVHRLGAGTIEGIAFSPDGSILAVASSRGVYLYDPRTLKEVAHFGEDRKVRSLAFSPDGSLLAVSLVGRIQLRRIPEGTLIRTLAGGADVLAFSPDGALLAGAYREKVYLWRVADGTLRFSWEGAGDMVSLAFSEDGAFLRGASAGGYLHLWRVSDGMPLMAAPSDEKGERVRVAALSFHGKYLALGREDGLVSLKAVGVGEVQDLIEKDLKPIRSLAFSPDGRYLASGSAFQILVWALEEGRALPEPVFREVAIKGTAEHLAFSPDGRLLAAGAGNSLYVWQVEGEKELARRETFMGSVEQVRFSPDGSKVASVSEDGVVRLWDVAEGRLLYVMEGTSVAFHPEGGVWALGSEDGQVTLWEVPARRIVQQLKPDEEGGVVERLAFSPDGAYLAVGRWNEVGLWRLSDGKKVHTLEGISTHILAFSPTGLLLTGGGGLQIWRTPKGALQQRLLEVRPWSSVEGAAFSPRCDLLVASGLGDPHGLVAWRFAEREWQHAWTYPLDPGATSVAFSPDGRLLAVGFPNGRVDLGLVSEGSWKPMHTLAFDTDLGGVWNLAFSPDGSYLAVALDDGTVRLWGVPERDGE